jgi:hypothetical protein
MTLKRLLAGASLIVGLMIIPAKVSAQSNQQLTPPQQNPQTNVSGNLQPTGSGLQTPSTSSAQTNTGFSQDQLTDNGQVLRVIGTNTPDVSVQGVSTTTTATTTQITSKKSFNLLWAIIPVLGLGFLGVTYWQFSRPSKRYS